MFDAKRALAILLFLATFSFDSSAQKQLVIFNHGKVAYRFTEGSNINFILKNHQHREGFIVELSEFSMITSNDTIAFQSISKVKRDRGVNIMSGIGGLFFVGGLGYVAVDQVNGALGYGVKGWDQADNNALILAGVGAVILFVKPKYQRVDRGMMIRTIDYKSPYYLSPQ